MADELNNQGSVNTSTEINTGDNVEKTSNEAEVQALLQQEADRRVSSALKKQQKQFESKMEEAEKLRTMDDNQRKEYEYQQKK